VISFHRDDLERVGHVDGFLVFPDEPFNLHKYHTVFHFYIFYFNCVISAASEKFFARAKILFISDFFPVKSFDLQCPSPSAKQSDVLNKFVSSPKYLCSRSLPSSVIKSLTIAEASK